MEVPVRITSEQILASVKQELKLESTTDRDIYLDDLIGRGARRLGTTETFVLDNCFVTSENNGFNFPKDCKEIIAFRWSQSCYQGVFIDIPFFKGCGCNTIGFSPVGSVMTLNNRRAYFVNQVPDGDEFEIAYKKINRDCHGFIIIDEEQEEALINYVCWKYSNAFPKDFTTVQMADWRNDYQSQAARCRGLAARRTFDKEKAQIRSRMNSIVSLPQGFTPFLNLFNNFFYTQTP